MAKRTPRKRRLETRLLGLSTPLFLLDAKRRVVFFNDGCERITGWKRADVIGRVCDYVPPGDASKTESPGTLLAPPPAVFLQRRPLTVPATFTDSRGNPVAKLIHFHTLTDEDDAVDLILGLIFDPESPAAPASASATQRLHAELAAIRIRLRQRYGLRSFVARSTPMLRVADQIKVAVVTESAVLISGEKGTGREHVARIIHNEVSAGSRTFIPLDCARLPMRDIRNTLRRMLQLDEPRNRQETVPAIGLSPGTVFLQSVEKLGRDIQEMLVNAYREFPTQLPAGIRLLSATGADLQQAVQQDVMRSDFYFLLTTMHIDLPPLRNRPEDLEPLGQCFLEESNAGAEQQIGGFTDAVWEQFRQYRWPGNLTELATVIEESRAACHGTDIEPRHLPFRFRTGLDAQSVGPAVLPQTEPLEKYLARVEADHIRDVLQKVRYNKTLAAKSLGMTRPRLYRRMQTLGIDDPEG